MRAVRTVLAALFVILGLSQSASADDRLGIVLLHGKGGLPQQFTPMAASLASQGYLTEQPEMCWSRNRIYDRLYLDCLRDIDTAADRLKERGATAIVVLGMSLGGNAALAYGARHPGLKGVIALVPGHAPEFISRRPEIAASLDLGPLAHCVRPRKCPNGVHGRQHTNDILQLPGHDDAEYLLELFRAGFRRRDAGQRRAAVRPAVVRRRQQRSDPARARLYF